jgi:hypothetical protein
VHAQSKLTAATLTANSPQTLKSNKTTKIQPNPQKQKVGLFTSLFGKKNITSQAINDPSKDLNSSSICTETKTTEFCSASIESNEEIETDVKIVNAVVSPTVQNNQNSFDVSVVTLINKIDNSKSCDPDISTKVCIIPVIKEEDDSTISIKSKDTSSNKTVKDLINTYNLTSPIATIPLSTISNSTLKEKSPKDIYSNSKKNNGTDSYVSKTVISSIVSAYNNAISTPQNQPKSMMSPLLKIQTQTSPNSSKIQNKILKENLNANVVNAVGSNIIGSLEKKSPKQSNSQVSSVVVEDEEEYKIVDRLGEYYLVHEIK